MDNLVFQEFEVYSKLYRRYSYFISSGIVGANFRSLIDIFYVVQDSLSFGGLCNENSI